MPFLHSKLPATCVLPSGFILRPKLFPLASKDISGLTSDSNQSLLFHYLLLTLIRAPEIIPDLGFRLDYKNCPAICPIVSCFPYSESPSVKFFPKAPSLCSLP